MTSNAIGRTFDTGARPDGFSHFTVLADKPGAFGDTVFRWCGSYTLVVSCVKHDPVGHALQRFGIQRGIYAVMLVQAGEYVFQDCLGRKAGGYTV